MSGQPKSTRRFRFRALTALLALLVAAPTAFANTNTANVPPAPTVTSPAAGSRLADPSKVTVRGGAPSFTKATVTVRVFHVRNGRRIDGGQHLTKGATVSNGQWQATFDLPRMQRGWEDVRYEISAVLHWDKRPEQHHITEKPSAATVVEVFPQSQPEPLPTAPPAPVIQTPTSSTILPADKQFVINGTGTPGNRVRVATELLYALDTRPAYEFKSNSASTTVTVGSNGAWQASAPSGRTRDNYVNARNRITATELHRENNSLASNATIRDVPVEVPAKRALTPQEAARASVDAQIPAGITMSAREEARIAATRDALTRPAPKVTTPAADSRVNGTMEVSGTAAPGSNLRINVKRTIASRSRPGGKPVPPRSGAGDDLGTFTAKTNADGTWRIRAVTLPTIREMENAPDVDIVVSVVEVHADGSSGTPHTVSATQVP